MTILRRRARLAVLAAPQSVAAAPPSSGLELAEIRLFPLREPVSGREYTVLRARTRAGLTGWGECARGSAEDLAALRKDWGGRPATSYAAFDPASPLSGGLDMALLDIVGKACRAPVYRVLGGPTRNKVRAMTSVAGNDTGEKIAAAERSRDQGFRAVSVRVPPPAARNQGRAYQNEIRALCAAFRARTGENFDLVLDGHGLLTPGDAAGVAATIENTHPLWFDEPCSPSNLETVRKISSESVVPLGFGREVTDPGVFQALLRSGFIDVVRPDLLRAGITRSRRLAALAETYYVAIAPHHEGGPIATAAALHVAASVPNFFIQHVPRPPADADRSMRRELVPEDIETPRDGFLALLTGPGLGINVNESALEKYRAA